MIRMKSTSTPRLPEGYQEVDYIESSGSQYIDTGVAPTKTTRVVIDMQFLEVSDASAFGIYGDSDIDNCPASFAWGYTRSSANWCIILSDTGNILKETSETVDTSRNIWDLSTDTTKINDTIVYPRGTQKITITSANNIVGSLLLFGVKDMVNSGKITYSESARVYSCKIYDDTTLIRDFVPCYRKSDNGVGLYDLANNKFYENASNHSDLPDEDGNATPNEFIMGSIVGAQDLSLKPYIGNKKITTRYIGDNLIYGKAISSYSQKINYTMLYDNIHNDTNKNQCNDATGGWSSGFVYSTFSTVGTFELNESGMSYGENSTSGYGGKYAYTRNQLDFDDIDFLFAKINADGYGYRADYPLYDRYSYGPKADNQWEPGGYMYKSSYWLVPEGYDFKHYTTTSNIDETYTKMANLKGIAGNRHLILWAQSSALSNQRLIDTCYNLASMKQDDWQMLCNKAGLDANNYDDEVALCADSDAITTILSNKNAVEYMIYNCTGSFMGRFVINDDCLTILNNSEYKTIIQANEHWNKFLAMVVA